MISEHAKSTLKRFLYLLSLSEMVEATVSVKMSIQYACSRCGGENEIKSKISQTSTNGVSFPMTPDLYYQEKRRNAQAGVRLAAVNRLVKRQKRIQGGSTLLAARAAGVSCRCSRCGHKEPWAKLNVHLIPGAVLISFVLGFVLLLLYLCGVIGWPRILRPLLGIAAIVLFAATAEGLLLMVRKIQIHRLPPESLPKFTFQHHSGPE